MHVQADVTEVEGLQITVAGGVEEDQDGHDFRIRHVGLAVAALLSWNINEVFFQFWLKNKQDTTLGFLHYNLFYNGNFSQYQRDTIRYNEYHKSI